MNVLQKVKRFKKGSGQSLVELAIIFPLLLIMLAGMVEVAFGMFAYLTALDLTREAARFASIRDYHEQELENPSDPTTACTDNVLHYYYDTACFFTDDALNPFLDIRANKYDDVVITVFTVANDHISDHHPDADGWSLYSDNWKKDCQGNVVRTSPFFPDSYIEDHFMPNAPTDRGIVLVETWVCYDMVLNLPFISDFIPSPFRLHTYTIMPAPEAIPTPTPIP